jgi:8-oxo-dGTP diphosphatase
MYANLLSDDLKLTVHDKAEWVTIRDLLSYQLAPADIPLAKHLQAQLQRKYINE